MKKKIMAMMLAAACIGTGTLNYATEVNAAEQGTAFIMGDVNDDGAFSISDVVLLQKWLLGVPDTHLANWKAADFCADNKLNALDMTLMKRALLYGGTVQSDTDLKTKFPEYYDQETFKGLEVYLWQETDGGYKCGLLMGTNRNKTDEEIIALTNNGATIEEMKVILSSYSINDDMIVIIPIRISEASYEIMDSDFESVRKMFWGDDSIEPPADHIAPLGFKTADDAIKEIIQSDLSEIEGYAQMFERFRNDGFIYHFTDAENAVTLQEDRTNAAVWLMPYDYFEDTGILYHVAYQGKDYQVYYYFNDPAFPESDLWDYMEQRLHTENINVVDEKYGIVEHSNGGHPVVSAYFAIDDTHYCKVKTFEPEDALKDFLQVLNHDKLDIADNSIDDPVVPMTAQPIGYKDMESAIEAIHNNDVNAYPEQYYDNYRKMFDRFSEDGFIYHFADDENAITLREDHPNAAVWLMPYANYEDTGVLYHVAYQGKYYQVYYYFNDPAYTVSDLWEYIEQRLGIKNFNVVDEKYGIVDNSNGEQSVVSAYFAIDDTHYCKVKTFEQEDALMDFLQVLNYEKLDIADNSEVFVPVNSSDTDLDKSAIAGKIFAYEKEGAGGYCTLSFNENGRFLYSPGKLSSYMDGGDWKIDGDTVSLIGMENKTIYLKITDDTLVYIAEGSDEFPYMDIKDGEKFVIYRPEISADKFQLNSRYSEYGLGDPKVELDLIVSELPEFCYVEDVRLYDEDDNFIGMMSPAMDADIWNYLVDCHVTEECSKTYYTLSKIRCGEKTYLNDVRSEITVNFKATPAP